MTALILNFRSKYIYYFIYTDILKADSEIQKIDKIK